jgi:hypothetical protein
MANVGDTDNIISKIFEKIDKVQAGLFGSELGTFLKDQIKEMTNFTGALIALDKESADLSKNFLLGRTRINEFKGIIADTAPIVRELGGDIGDINAMIKDTGEALGRNVLFTPEVYGKIFAINDLLGTQTSTLARNFSNAGISIAKVGGDIEASLNYIKSIGMDAKSIMNQVVNNTDQLNRFNFKEGVLGFSKMAATATLLKTDMSTIQSLADKVFNVEGAIDTAAAFQRLGVFMGDLADPFSLMNSSLNNPEGLIKSIAKAGERFTEFNAETGRVEINPSAMGMFNELAAASGIGADKLKQMAISLREFNERASQINFKFDLSEEQQMLIANLAFLDEKGEYVVNIKDQKTGEMIAQKVSDLTEEQISKLKELSDEKPKTMEEIAKESMSITDIIKNDVQAIKYKILFGVAGTPALLKAQESVRGEIGMGYDYLRELIPDMKDTRKFLTNIGTDIINSYKNSGNFEGNLEKILSNFPNFGDVLTQMNKAGEKSGFNDSLTKDMLDKLSSATGISGNDFKNLIKPYFNVGGPEYIGTEIIKNTTTNINNSKDNKVNFNLTIDVIHKSMDSTGAIKSMNQVERINQSFKDNAFGKKLTINIPNK